MVIPEKKPATGAIQRSVRWLIGGPLRRHWSMTNWAVNRPRPSWIAQAGSTTSSHAPRMEPAMPPASRLRSRRHVRQWALVRQSW